MKTEHYDENGEPESGTLDFAPKSGHRVEIGENTTAGSFFTVAHPTSITGGPEMASFNREEAREIYEALRDTFTEEGDKPILPGVYLAADSSSLFGLAVEDGTGDKELLAEVLIEELTEQERTDLIERLESEDPVHLGEVDG